MTRIFALLLCMLLGAAHGTARIPVEGKLELPEGEPAAGVKLSLNAGEHTAYSRRDGSFSFHDVSPGVYLLDVLSVTHMFGQVRVSVQEDRVRAIAYAFPGAEKELTGYPVTLRAHAKYQYFEKRAPLSFRHLLKNPMMLMGLFMVAVMFFMPKMMENMDPEQMREMQAEMAKNQADPQEVWNKLFGSKDDDDD